MSYSINGSQATDKPSGEKKDRKQKPIRVQCYIIPYNKIPNGSNV